MIQIGVVILVLAVAVASIRRPAAAFGLAIALLPTEQLLQAGIPAFATVPWLGNFLLALIPAFAAILIIARGQFSLSSYLHPLLIASVLLYVWLGLSILWSLDQITAIDSMRVGVPNALMNIVLAPILIRSLDDAKVALRSALFYGTGLAILIAVDPNFELDRARLGVALDEAQRTNPLELGTLGGRVMLLAALGAVLVSGPFGLVLRTIALLAGAAVGILSGSRGQVVFAIMLAIGLYPVSRRIADFTSFILTGIGAMILAVALFFGARLFVGAENEERWSVESLTQGGSGRLDNAIDLLAAYINSPGSWIQGLGFRSFGVLPTSTGDIYSHVSTVDALAEGGIIGFALFATIICGGALAWWSLFRAIRDRPQERAIATILLAGFLYSFMLSNKQGTVWSAFGAFLMAIVIGRCAASHFAQEAADREAEEELELESDGGDADLSAIEATPSARPSETVAS